jgi:hypothetical protein
VDGDRRGEQERLNGDPEEPGAAGDPRRELQGDQRQERPLEAVAAQSARAKTSQAASQPAKAPGFTGSRCSQIGSPTPSQAARPPQRASRRKEVMAAILRSAPRRRIGRKA